MPWIQNQAPNAAPVWVGYIFQPAVAQLLAQALAKQMVPPADPKAGFGVVYVCDDLGRATDAYWWGRGTRTPLTDR